MKVLIKCDNEAVAAHVKEMLESFGKGMHIYTHDDGFSYYKCVICVGDTTVWNEPELLCQLINPATTDDWAALKSTLWRFYRDHIKDAFGTKCTCGLYEYCHCH